MKPDMVTRLCFDWLLVVLGTMLVCCITLIIETTTLVDIIGALGIILFGGGTLYAFMRVMWWGK